MRRTSAGEEPAAAEELAKEVSAEEGLARLAEDQEAGKSAAGGGGAGRPGGVQV
ncbi:hypothetical protein LG943_23785 [Streptomonospora sp. S1-112]|uniref:Uncharacterized protein n=1 Tax=Streptomonospora mangrovi TaxID=2883123 RepID=A0A9X3NPW8_9ACTN|nr:hypothetical protein [Streptomonospora mangrovi]MDA0567317.1 hypothetical protein [Streptomonospora mangrovi]